MKGRRNSETDKIFVIRQLSQKYRTLYNNFIDYKQAFGSVWQLGLLRVTIEILRSTRRAGVAGREPVQQIHECGTDRR